MIKLIEIKTGSAFWEIDGVVIRFQRKKSIGDDLTGHLIKEYRDLLLNENYRKEPMKISELDNILGSVILLRIGAEAYFDAFMRMFSYYTELYVKEWCDAGKRFSTNKTSVFPVFVYMFRNQLVDKAESPVGFLKNTPCDNQLFLDIYEEKFTVFWAERIKARIEKQEPLYAIKEQIGSLQTTKSFCRLPIQIVTSYLQTIASRFTKERKCSIIRRHSQSPNKMLFFQRELNFSEEVHYEHGFHNDMGRKNQGKGIQWLKSRRLV